MRGKLLLLMRHCFFNACCLRVACLVLVCCLCVACLFRACSLLGGCCLFVLCYVVLLLLLLLFQRATTKDHPPAQNALQHKYKNTSMSCMMKCIQNKYEKAQTIGTDKKVLSGKQTNQFDSPNAKSVSKRSNAANMRSIDSLYVCRATTRKTTVHSVPARPVHSS